jgi:hypothetical protein
LPGTVREGTAAGAAAVGRWAVGVDACPLDAGVARAVFPEAPHPAIANVMPSAHTNAAVVLARGVAIMRVVVVK